MTPMPLSANMKTLDPKFEASLPHRRMEAWRWTDVRAKMDAGLAGLYDPLSASIKSELEMINVSRETNDHPMSILAGQYSPHVTLIDVKEDQSERIELTALCAGHGRIVIKLGKNANLDLIETHHSETASFINLDIQIDLAEGATLNRTIWQNDHEDTNRIVTAQINLWGGAKLSQYCLGFGGRLCRLETNIAGLGEAVHIDMGGVYLLNNSRHIDMTSHIDLTAKSAKIDQSVKGVVTDRARAVFQGKFHVRRPAQLTDAQMRHDAMMLSDRSEIRAKPELEIYADDVACAHGNTIGALDESTLFYMRQRGIPLKQARDLLIETFLASAYDGANDDVRERAVAKIQTWLEKQS